MFYKRLVWGFVSIVGCIVLSALVLLVVIDPVEILGSPVIAGVNNQKHKEGNVLDIVKPYQYWQAKPKELYIGSSRVYVGFGPLVGEGDGAYNFGCSSMSLPDMLEYLKFCCRVHKPEKVYIGLDFFQFGKANYHTKRSGFDVLRLQKLSSTDSALMYNFLRLEEAISFITMDYLYGCYQASKKGAQEPPLFYMGCDIKRGMAETNEEEYQYYLQSFGESYSAWEYEPLAMEKLKECIELLRGNNIRAKVFFNPISYDLQRVLQERGKDEAFSRIKREVAGFTKVYDFAQPSEITRNKSNYYDSSHYRIEVGKKIKKLMDEDDLGK